MEEGCNLLTEEEWCDAVLVGGMVLAHVFAGFTQHSVEVRTDAGVGDAHVVAQIVDLVDGTFVNQDARQLLFSGDHNAVFGADSDDCFTLVDCGEGVTDLGELA